LNAFREMIEGGSYISIVGLAEQEDKAVVQIAGSISSLEKKLTRRDGKPFAILTVEDFTGAVEVMVWGEVYAKAAKEIEKGKIVAITGRLDKRDETLRIVANEIEQITKPDAGRALIIDIPIEKADEKRLIAIRDLVRRHPGTQPLYLRFRSADGREIRLKADADYSVRDSEPFREKLAELFV
jgi:DNA polymerase III subunit alpha